MLPKPNCTFEIPNLNDDLELNCRLYFPKPFSKSSDVGITGFAVFAHPYTPLGGCFDDPIVQTVGSILLKNGFVLCTFNFRGASGSAGRTSWTGKAELADYVSVYTFMLHMVNDPELLAYVSLVENEPLLLLGGYSYGSMIASHLPDVQAIQKGSNCKHLNSTDHEIQLKAEEINKILLGYLETSTHRGRLTSRSDGNVNSMRGVMMGGLDPESETRRASRESNRRSIDVERVRHSIERVKNKFNRKSSSSGSVRIENEGHSPSDDDPTFTLEPRIAYLLVSPLLQLVAGFTTIFSKLVFERKTADGGTHSTKSLVQNLTENPTLAIYGDKDIFTSARKLRKWSQELQSIPNSQFSAEEVTGAGHFWHEHEALQQLRTSVNAWLTNITSSQTQDRATE